MEGMSSLLVAQNVGQKGKRLVGDGEGYQFALLISTAVAYVISAWIIVVVSVLSALCERSYLSSIPRHILQRLLRRYLLHS